MEDKGKTKAQSILDMEKEKDKQSRGLTTEGGKQMEKRDVVKTTDPLYFIAQGVIPAFMVIITVLAIVDIRVVFEPPLLLLLLNALFISVMSFVVASISASNYLKRGSLSFLLLGCGVLAVGSGALVGGWLIGPPGGPNVNVTIYDSAALLGAVFHAISAILASAGINSDIILVLKRKSKMILAYLSVLVFTALLTIASLRGATPPYIIQGIGPTLLGRAVLGTAVALFGISSLLFTRLYSKSKEPFQYWYSLALALIAVGLSAVFLQKGVGSPIGWAGRSAQYLSGIYFLIAVLTTYTEGRLRISEEKLRSVFASSPDAITVMDLNGNILECNQSALDIHGCSSKDEVLGKNTFEFIAKKDHERAVEGLKRTLEQGSVKDIEYTFLTKEGFEFPVKLSASVIKDSYGTPTGFVAIARDITERVRAEKQLRQQSVVLDGINKVLLETLTCESEREMACTCLAVAEELTGSKFGFICEVNQAGRFDTLAISNPGWDACTIPETEAVLMLRDMEIRGIRGRVIKEERSMVFNNPASHADWVGIPEGHPPITCFLGVPLKQADRTIGMIGLANKESGYDLADQQAIETLSVAFVEALNRKRAEEALRESQQLLEKTFASLEEAVFVVDPTTRTIIACNSAVERMFGYSEKEVIGKNTEFLHVDRTMYERFGQELFPALDAHGVFHTEFQLRRKDGSIFFSEHTVTEILDDSGQRTGVVSVVRDITERKRVEEALHESEERHRSLFEHVPVGLYRSTSGGQILDANPALAEMLGYSDRHSLLEVNAADVYVNAEDRQRWQTLMDSEGVVQGFEAQLRRRDGTIIWGRDSARAIQDSEGRVLYYEGAVKDITEPKMAEETLRQRADDLAALYEASQAFLGHLDTEVIIEGICRLAVDRLGLKMAWVGLVVEGSFDLRPASAYGFEEGYLDSIRVTWDDSPTGRGPTGTAIRTCQATVMNHIESHPSYAPWREAAKARGYRSSAALPLCHGEQVLGALNVYSAEPAYFTAEQVQVLQSFANQAALAIQNAGLFEQVRAGHERLQTLSRQLLKVQEAERRHIACELHDEVGQALTGLKLLLDMSTRLPADEVTASLGEAQAMVNELMALVRDLSLDLRPAMLDDLGLLPTLLWHFDRYTAQTSVRVRFKHSGLEGRFAPEAETATYRIVQEALTNVARHAGVSEVMVRLWANQDTLGLQIEDRGTGFDPEAALAAGATTGLAGMRERAVLLGGQLRVESAPEAGTRVTAELPLGHVGEEGEKGR